MEEEYIRLMDDTVSAILRYTSTLKSTRSSIINTGDSDKADALRQKGDEFLSKVLDFIDTRIKRFGYYYTPLFSDYTLAKRFKNVYFSEVEDLWEDIQYMDITDIRLTMKLENLAKELDKCKGYILRNRDRRLPF